MGADRTDGEAEGCSVLNGQSFDRVGVVAAPDLRGVIEHACVKSAAAARARFQKERRIAREQPFHKIVHAEHIAVQSGTPAAAGFESISHTTVHVPFDVVDPGRIEERSHLIENRLTDLRS